MENIQNWENEQIYERVSRWFDAHKEQMLEDLKRIVAYPSVSDPKAEAKPFGQACKDCMDEMLQIGREHGFYTENYDYYVGSIGQKEKNWDNMIGFWNHLDVVPVGNDWVYEPFGTFYKEPYLIARGSQDNKGPAIGMLYLMQCFRELELPLKHELCLFVGSDEERGMSDLAYYTKNYPTPALSMIADSGFPVCYGEKGIIEGCMQAVLAFSDDVIELYGGNASNMIPDRASAILKGSDLLKEQLQREIELLEKRDKINETDKADDADKEDKLQKAYTLEEKDGNLLVTAFGESRHSAFPQGSINAIHKLCLLLSKTEGLCLQDRTIFGKIAYLSEEYYGEHTGIAYSDEVSGETSCALTLLSAKDQKAVLTFNIRYSITADSAKMEKTLEQTAIANDMDWICERNSKPNYFPKEHPAVELLTQVYNTWNEDAKESFVMGGGTYARMLPNAFAYGIGGMEESEEDKKVKEELLKPGHGGAHGPDEALNFRLLVQAMKIYAMAILAMNECPLK